MNYYPFHIGDFRSGTVSMSRQSRWIYRDMLDMYYDTESPLSLDIDLLCHEIGVESGDDRAIVERLLRFKFEKTQSGYIHTTCEKVIAEYHGKAKTARANGRLGGRPSKANSNLEKPSGFLSGSYPDAISNPVATGSEANQEPITNNQEPVKKVNPIAPSSDEAFSLALNVQAVFSYWQNQRGHERAKLDDKRKKVIKARFKDGYSVEDLCRAVDGVSRSAHHMGQNDSRTVYDDIDLICRTAANVDKFSKLADPQQFTDPGLQRQVEILQDWMDQP